MLRKSALPLIAVALLLTAETWAQSPQTSARPDRGAVQGSSYAVSDIETISLTNGNVNLSIPLASLPQIAGGKLSWTLSATYNSKLWNVIRRQEDAADTAWRPYTVDMPQLSDMGGWQIGGQYSIFIRNAHEDFDFLQNVPESSGLPYHEREMLQSGWYKMVLRTPDGAEREFRPVGGSEYSGSQDFLRGYFNTLPSPSAPIKYYSFDGTYMAAVVKSTGDWTLFMPDGIQVVQTPDGIQRIKDTNGNAIKIFSDANGTHYQDEQTGREIRVTYDPAANGGQGQRRVWYQAVGGTWVTIDINYGWTRVQGKLYRVTDWNANSGEYGNGEACERDEILTPADVQVVREIVLPQTEPGQARRRFTFSYNSDTTENFTTNLYRPACGMAYETLALTSSIGWGSLSRVATPAGAVVNYSYSLDSVNETPLQTPDHIAEEAITQKQITHDGTTDTWDYSISHSVGSVTNPDGSFTQERFHSHSPGMSYSVGRAGLVYRSSNFNSVIERHWTNLTFSGASTTSPGGAVNFNPIVDVEYVTLIDPQGNALKMSAKTFQHDYNGNVRQVTEYDWFSPSLVTRDINGIPTGVPAAASVLRTTNTSYHNSPASAGASEVYAKRSYATGTPSIINAVRETSTGTSRTQTSYDGQPYGYAPTAGNVTATGRFDDLGDANPANDRWVTSSKSYDAYGNQITSTDANGNVTQLFYEDATRALPTRVVIDPLNGTGTQTTTTAYDFSTGRVTSQTDANNQVSTTDYTNQLLGTIDPLGRPGVEISPAVSINGVSHRRKIFTFYEDAARRVRVESDLNVEGDRLLKSRQTHDQMGRETLTETSENGSSYTVSGQSVYLAMGRIVMSSNPKRAGVSSSSEGWTRTTKDAAGRISEVSTFAGSPQPPATGTNPNWTGTISTSYNGNETTVTDQQSKSRRSVMDGLGRLTQVIENPGGLNYETNYSYDMLGNLRKIDQGGQLRFFMYDSLSRLVRAKNPEQSANANLTVTDPVTGHSQWSLAYSYDYGNLSSKVDARNVTSTYTYDGFARNTTIDYSDTPGINPDVTRVYDGATLGKGRFWYDYKGGNYSAGTEVEHRAVDAYDAQGRPLSQRQLFKTGNVWGASYRVQRSYHLAGNVRSQTYPSGHTVNYTQDEAGRIKGFTGNLGDGATRTYASGISYDAAGRLAREQFGTTTPLHHKRHYNSRGQLFDVRLAAAPDEWAWDRGAIVNYYDANRVWGANGTDNNGNLRYSEVDIPLDPNATYTPGNIGPYAASVQSYSYDSLDRLTSVGEQKFLSTGGGLQSSFTQAYIYDRWGNRQVNQGGTTQTLPSEMRKASTVDTTTNRLSVPAGQTGVMSYDAAGNLTTDSYTGAGARTYDAENRMTSAVIGINSSSTYTYDADGKRVRRSTPDGTVWQIYGFDSELLAEYSANAAPASPQKEYGYRNGELLITAEGSSGGAAATAASFVKTDTTTQGTWKSAYGTDGYLLASEGVNYPAYAQVSVTGHFIHTWAATTTDVRGLQKSASGSTDRIASTWYSGTEFTIDLNLTDGQTHQVALYCLDWDYNNVRAQRVDVLDAATNALLDSRNMSAYKGGQYVVWNLRGHVKLKMAYTGPAGLNATVSGLFFDAARVNVASAAQGASASASSVYPNNGTYAAASAINGDRRGMNWGAGGGWNDATPDAYPDWLQVNFAGAKSIDEIDVFTCQDNYANPVEPTETQTFSVYGLTGYEVQFWTGSVWANVPGASVVGNNRVWRKFTFPAITTTKIRVLTSAGLASHSRLTEVEAYQTTQAANSSVQWLVADQLGTPRMVADLSGSLQGIKRHDQLPFGEELHAGMGGRTTQQGFSQADNVRQKFTSKERDTETGLDYFIARYYTSTQGRFTSIDPANIKLKTLINPQDLNRYAYVSNNPLKYIDPDGEEKIQIIVETFIPAKSVSVTFGGTHKGDNRPVPEAGQSYDGGSFRTQQIVTIETDPSKNGGNPIYGSIYKDTGVSNESDREGKPRGKSKQASGKTLTGGVSRNKDGSVDIHLQGDESNPNVPGSPGITYHYNINVRQEKDGKVIVTVTGSHDKYPAHVIAATRIDKPKAKTTTVYSFSPDKAGTDPLSLLPPLPNQRVNVREVLP